MNYDSLLNDKIKNIKPSGIRKFFDILEEMTDAISLGIGEPDFVTPWHIRDAGIYSLEKGHTKYTSNAGMLELRREIARYMSRRFDLHYEHAGQILVTVGGSEAIDLTLRVLLNPGDEVIIPVPSFVCYGPLTEMAYTYIYLCGTERGKSVPFDTRTAKGSHHTKNKSIGIALPIQSHRGHYGAERFGGNCRGLKDTNIMVLSDEIYAELTYGQRHVSMANLPEMYERTVVVNGFSKSHAMTGWRMGYVCAPKPVIAAMTKLHQFGIMSAPTTSQYAAVEAMRNGDGDIANMCEEYDSRRRYLVENLNRIGLECFEPKGAFYVFPCIKSTGLTSEEFCQQFLMEEKVAVIPGNAFGPGGEGYVRACYASSMKDIAEAVSRMDNFLTNLRRRQGK